MLHATLNECQTSFQLENPVHFSLQDDQLIRARKVKQSWDVGRKHLVFLYIFHTIGLTKQWYDGKSYNLKGYSLELPHVIACDSKSDRHIFAQFFAITSVKTTATDIEMY
jgi:hypothetical protein